MKSNFDCIIVGAGPAGLTAAMYLKRSNKDVLVIEKGIPGGQINYASVIENYPGFEIVEGPALANAMYEQASKMGVVFKSAEVISVKNNEGIKIVNTDSDAFESNNVIIAIGRKRKKLDIPNEDKFIGRGISFCALCDGMFFRNKDIAVIGGGNSAIEEAIHLSKIVNHVTIVHRRSDLSADDKDIETLKGISNIDILYDTKAIEFVDTDNKFSGVNVLNTKTNIYSTLLVNGAFIYIGFEPKIEIINDLSIVANNGYIVVDKNCETNIQGIYACGDIVQKDTYQITTAIGEGSIAANAIIKANR